MNIIEGFKQWKQVIIYGYIRNILCFDYMHLVAQPHDGKGDRETETAGQQHHAPEIMMVRRMVVVVVMVIFLVIRRMMRVVRAFLWN